MFTLKAEGITVGGVLRPAGMPEDSLTQHF